MILTVHKMRKLYMILILAAVFLFSFYIRILNNIPDKLMSFDPIFMYRNTQYVVTYGHLPLWDELSYYPGKIVDYGYAAPLMFYMTALLYKLLHIFGWSLMTVASYAGALYGAMIVIPAFLLVREFSNEKGGLMAATLIGAAPVILQRTFGSSYDTDQLVIFFLLLSLWAIIRMMKNKSIPSFCIAVGSLAGFMMAYSLFSYAVLIVIFGLFVYFFVYILHSLYVARKTHQSLNHFKDFYEEIKKPALMLLALLITVMAIGFVSGADFISSFTALNVYVSNMNIFIVNISIAELQNAASFSDIYGLLVQVMGGFVINMTLVDNLLFVAFIIFIGFAIYGSRKNTFVFSFILAFIITSVLMITKGARFTEIAASLMICVIGSGFGYLIKTNSDYLRKTILAIGILIVLAVAFMGFYYGQNIGPDNNVNWDNAFAFLRTNTSALSLVGTWWDPGHMITGIADRRVIADGAHCSACKYNINDRIIDLGAIMATDNENTSISLINKYKGDSPDVYWIASNDLVYKYQWLEYFGLGCDPFKDIENCPVYNVFSQTNQYTDTNTGQLAVVQYSNGFYGYFNGNEIPLFWVVNGINGYMFKTVILNDNGVIKSISLSDIDFQNAKTIISPLENQFNFRFTNETADYIVYLDQSHSSITLIHPKLTNTVFFKMWFLSGKGLNCFNLVYSNNDIRIFKVNTECKT
jgi:asparagine N-glycosylation enzyme membrane subunit Stt3